MAAAKTTTQYGWVTRTLHWGIALMVFGALGVGTWLARSEPSLAKIPYYATHKSVGMTIFALILLRLAWHRISPTPPVVDHGGWQSALAKAVHRAFYLLLIAMPMSGWVASSATGIDTVIFKTFTLPRIAPVSERWAEIGFQIHGLIGWAIAGLIILHVAGALVRRDGTFARMARGTARSDTTS